MTLHTSKGLEFPVVAIAGIGFLPHRNENEVRAARLLYVGMTRAAGHLMMTASGESTFIARLNKIKRASRVLRTAETSVPA